MLALQIYIALLRYQHQLCDVCDAIFRSHTSGTFSRSIYFLLIAMPLPQRIALFETAFFQPLNKNPKIIRIAVQVNDTPQI
jgi:hypothetical protein